MSEHVNHTGVHRDDEAQKLGMWLFIFTELLLFGGLFLVYSIFRSQYPVEFQNQKVVCIYPMPNYLEFENHRIQFVFFVDYYS